MQNIPGIPLEQTTDQLKTARYTTVKTSEQQTLFAELFDQHSTMVENELALTPVSTNDKMLDAAPDTTTEEAKDTSNVTEAKAPVEEDTETTTERDRDELMTQEDLDEVRDDLEEYGLSEEEITEIEDKINSEEGLTWGQFVNVLSDKMADMREVTLSDQQQEELSTFFAKFGFTSQESSELISKLENGEHAEVMAALQKKIDNMPEGQQLLITKDEMEAFSAAMNFSKEFTSKIKEVFGSNMLSKDVKEAFTMIRQELVDMDSKDQELVKAVGKAFVKAMGDTVKESTVAKTVDEAVDLKTRVAEDAPKVEVKEAFKDAVETRKETQNSTNDRISEQKVMPEKAESDVLDQNAGDDSDANWNNFFGKLQDNSTHKTTTEFQAKTENIESALKTAMTDATTKGETKTWEKISAPKVMQQVENAVIKNLSDGTKQLTLQLTPENLGKLSVVLQVQGKEVSATIRAENADAAKIIADNIDIIKSSLENQGLKVDKLEVQTGLTNNNDFNAWSGSDEHNLAREREAMIAMRSHMKQMREENSLLGQGMQNAHEQVTNSSQGLHVIA